MVFSSQTFLFVFLPLVLLAYALAPRRGRNTVLLVFSMLFYVWGGGWFVGWLLGSIAGNWAFGGLAARARAQERPRALRLVVAGSVIFNIGILAWFKYANFFVDQLNGLGESLGYEPMGWVPVMLPIGISFFTFQANSYVFDIARGEGRAMRNPLDFALYVALFPQLIAGPIVRYHQIADQLARRVLSYENVTAGMVRFTHGLCKKVLIADSVAPIADVAFLPGADLTTTDAWVGIIAYTIQIYFDFSGYSDMAIGLGRMFGFTFPENFRRPYASASMTEFWRRWHVTLSAWFRDYVYIPLGGSRRSRLMTYRNLVLVFLLTGFWHGANWTFIAWGVFHGFWLIVDRAQGRPERPTGVRLAIKRAWVLLLVMLGWVVFRAPTLGDAGAYYGILFFGNTGELSLALQRTITPLSVAGLAVGSLAFVAPRDAAIGPLLEGSVSAKAAWMRYAMALLALPLTIMLIVNGTFSPFLYFQF